MKTYHISILLLFIMSVSSTYSQELQFKEFDTVLKNFLIGYCDEGEEQTMPHKLRALGINVESQILFLIQNGVPDELIENLQESSRIQYQQRQEWLKSEKTFGLDEDDLKAAQEETLDQFIKRQTDSFSEGFMSQTYFALALIDTPRGNNILEDTADNTQSPYQNYAQNALKFKDQN